MCIHCRLKSEVEALLGDPSCALLEHCDINKIEQWLLKLRFNELYSDSRSS